MAEDKTKERFWRFDLDTALRWGLVSAVTAIASLSALLFLEDDVAAVCLYSGTDASMCRYKPFALHWLGFVIATLPLGPSVFWLWRAKRRAPHPIIVGVASIVGLVAGVIGLQWFLAAAFGGQISFGWMQILMGAAAGAGSSAALATGLPVTPPRQWWKRILTAALVPVPALAISLEWNSPAEIRTALRAYSSRTVGDAVENASEEANSLPEETQRELATGWARANMLVDDADAKLLAEFWGDESTVSVGASPRRLIARLSRLGDPDADTLQDRLIAEAGEGTEHHWYLVGGEREARCLVEVTSRLDEDQPYLIVERGAVIPKLNFERTIRYCKSGGTLYLPDERRGRLEQSWRSACLTEHLPSRYARSDTESALALVERAAAAGDADVLRRLRAQVIGGEGVNVAPFVGTLVDSRLAGLRGDQEVEGSLEATCVEQRDRWYASLEPGELAAPIELGPANELLLERPWGKLLRDALGFEPVSVEDADGEKMPEAIDWMAAQVRTTDFPLPPAAEQAFGAILEFHSPTSPVAVRVMTNNTLRAKSAEMQTTALQAGLELARYVVGTRSSGWCFFSAQPPAFSRGANRFLYCKAGDRLLAFDAAGELAGRWDATGMPEAAPVVYAADFGESEEFRPRQERLERRRTRARILKTFYGRLVAGKLQSPEELEALRAVDGAGSLGQETLQAMVRMVARGKLDE